MNHFNYGYLLDRAVRYFSGNNAIIDGTTGTEWTYADLARDVDAFHAGLTDSGLTKGMRVAALANHSYEYVALFFAVWKAGGILVPLNTRLSDEELKNILSDCSPEVIYTDQLHRGKISWSEIRCKDLRLPDRSGYTVSQKSTANLQADEPCMIVYTSGSTGAPKGAMLSGRMVHWNAVNTNLRLRLGPQDRAISFLPPFHTGGWHVLLTPLLMHGGSIVLCSKFDAGQILALTKRYAPTIIMGVPTTMALIAQHTDFSTTDFSSVRSALVGGEPMPVNEIRRWHERGVAVSQGYGLTEFGPNVFSLPPADAERKIGSIGTPNFYIDTRIVEGELWLKGPMSFSGYFGNPEATTHALTDDGWVRTGDVVEMDPEGFYYVVGRIKDMYISGGENVFPAEIENILRQHPSVREAAVVGQRSSKWGEVGHAFICGDRDSEVLEQELRALCAAKLARYKNPAAYSFIGELPKLGSGKINKPALRELNDGVPLV